jgi:tetratricopeptide (TPR) repeat protein
LKQFVAECGINKVFSEKRMPPLEEQAERAEEAGDFDEAFTLWRQLANQTRDPIDFCLAGRAAQKVQWWSDAEDAFSKALDLDPLSSEALGCMGSLFFNRTDGVEAENLQLARQWFKRALDVTRNAMLLTLMGCTCMALGDPDAARKALDEAVRLEPDYEEAYYNLAQLDKDVNPPKSVELLEKAIELDPDYGLAHQELGILLGKAGDVLKAEYHFRRCIEIDPSDYWSHMYLANELAVQGRFKEAEKEYRTAIILQPEEAAGYEFFADFLDRLARPEEASQVRARIIPPF